MHPIACPFGWNMWWFGGVHRLIYVSHYRVVCNIILYWTKLLRYWTVISQDHFGRVSERVSYMLLQKSISVIYIINIHYSSRADSRFATSQWETALLCNDVSHWLGCKPRNSPVCYKIYIYIYIYIYTAPLCITWNLVIWPSSWPQSEILPQHKKRNRFIFWCYFISNEEVNIWLHKYQLPYQNSDLIKTETNYFAPLVFLSVLRSIGDLKFCYHIIFTTIYR